MPCVLLFWFFRSLGYRTVGNEFDYFMLLMSNFMLNEVTNAGEYKIFPWIHEKNNHMSREDQLRGYVALAFGV